MKHATAAAAEPGEDASTESSLLVWKSRKKLGTVVLYSRRRRKFHAASYAMHIARTNSTRCALSDANVFAAASGVPATHHRSHSRDRCVADGQSSNLRR